MMKRICLFVLFNFIVFCLSGQYPNENVFQFNHSVADTSNNIFFKQNPDVPQLQIKFVKDISTALYLYRKNKDSVLNTASGFSIPYSRYIINESYDLRFAGDRYLLEEKYKNITLPIVPAQIMDKIANMPKCQKGGRAWLIAFICMDSIRYEFQLQCDSSGNVITFNPPGIGIPPKYIGNIIDLKRKIEKNIDKRLQIGKSDSALVLWGNVGKKGELSNIKLRAGGESYFATFIKKQIENPANKWEPADIGGIKMNGYIRFYVRMNADGSIRIESSPNLLIASGM